MDFFSSSIYRPTEPLLHSHADGGLATYVHNSSFVFGNQTPRTALVTPICVFIPNKLAIYLILMHSVIPLYLPRRSTDGKMYHYSKGGR
jgi:hypothetical protein